MHQSDQLGVLGGQFRDSQPHVETVMISFRFSDRLCQGDCERVASTPPTGVAVQRVAGYSEHPHPGLLGLARHAARGSPRCGQGLTHQIGCVFRIGGAAQEVAEQVGCDLRENVLDVRSRHGAVG